MTSRYDVNQEPVMEPGEKVRQSLVAAILAFPSGEYHHGPAGDRQFRFDVSRWYRATRRLAVKAATEATE